MMNPIIPLATLALPAGVFATELVIKDCAVARDRARCEARQAALKAYTDKRGSARTARLEDRIPPIDCTQASNAAKYEAAEYAKQVCHCTTGKEMKECLKAETPKQSAQKKPKKRSVTRPVPTTVRRATGLANSTSSGTEQEWETIRPPPAAQRPCRLSFKCAKEWLFPLMRWLSKMLSFGDSRSGYSGPAFCYPSSD